MANTNVKGIESNTAPFIAVEKNGYFQVGDPVRIEDMNSMSHMTTGTLQGLIHRGDDKVPMALVHWLENAPPIRILMTKLVRMKPVKFWMVVHDVEGDFQRVGSDDPQLMELYRNGVLSPAKKFFKHSEAVEVANLIRSRYRRNAVILESTEFVSQESGALESI